jgi:hypothetical protein
MNSGMDFTVNLPTGLISPSGEIAINHPAYSWQPINGMTWYKLWVEGPSGIIVNTWYDASQICKLTTCSIAPEGINLKDGEYTWWVLPWNSTGYDNWSPSMAFSVNAVPDLIAPMGTINQTTPIYTWKHVPGVTWYKLRVDDSSGTNVVNQWFDAAIQCNLTTCSVTPSVTLASDTYSWWVLPWNSTDGYGGGWSNKVDFFIQEIKLAWFYKPSSNGDLNILAQNYSTFILTRMDEDERDNLSSLGVNTPILQYLSFAAINDPGSCAKQPLHNQVAEIIGDFCSIVNQHPDWFLRDGLDALIAKDGSVLMDPSNLGWRNFWLERAKIDQEQYGWNGVFLDNVEASVDKVYEYGAIPKDSLTDASYQAAIEENLRFIYTTYFQPTGRPLYANIIGIKDVEVWYRYLQYLDGVMLENFAVGWHEDDYKEVKDWEIQMEMVEKTQSLGKTVILVSQGAELNNERQVFALASYLLVNNGKAYFRYTNDETYDQSWLYENYNLNIGKPLGLRYQEGDTWVRDYEHGKVSVNPTLHLAEIIFS